LRKYTFLIIAGVILLAAGIYYFQKNYLPQKPADAWDLVPATALIVYERDDCKTCLENIHQSPLWNIIENASFYNKELDSLKNSLKQTLASTEDLTISIHATKKDDFDFVFYIPALPEQLSQVAKAFEGKQYHHSKREFSDIEIHETSFAKQTFSWALVDGIWVGSFTPFLIEDVIRTRIKKNGFKKHLPSVQQLPQISDDAGNIYLQLSNFSEWLSLFYSDNKSIAGPFGQSTVLDIKSDPNHIVLNGFSVDTVGRSKYLLSIFRNQSPVSFNLKNFISNNTIALHSFGVSEGKSFNADLTAFVKQRAPFLKDSLERLGRSASVNFNSLYENIADEVGLCFMEASKGSRHSKILIIETKDPKPWLTTFEKIEDKHSIDTVFYERYGEYAIREIPVFRFPEKMFWPLITGFNQSFYTSSNNILFIADNLQDLKKFLSDLEEDETWGKSVSHNKFLETTLLESNLSIYINTPKVWNVLADQLHPKWSGFIRENQPLLRSVQLSAIQFSHLNNSYYTNVSINYKPVAASHEKSVREKYITNFDHGVQGLYAVKSHVDRSDEILVQDSLNDLTLISDEGEVLWKLSIGDRITSEVTQIDFYSNGKLQYFFATRTGLHVIDRLGNYVQPFPALLSSIEFDRASVVDYDHSKKYRFLAADNRGRLWMYDKDANNLEGWQPKDAGGPLVTAPRHHRIKGKDYIVAIRKDGNVLLMNRRGENLQNFPLDLKARLSGDYFLETGNSLSDTYFVVVSDDGFKIKFSVDGKIKSRETLFKTSVNTKFRLVTEKKFKTFLILQQDADHCNILNESGKQIISNKSVAANPVSVNYYDFGAGRIYISLTDMVQGLTYIYDETGQLLGGPPIQTPLLELRPKDADENKLFFVEGRSVAIKSIGR
jgi:hypothetical protein